MTGPDAMTAEKKATPVPMRLSESSAGHPSRSEPVATGSGTAPLTDSSLVVISTYTVEDAQSGYDLIRELRSLANEVLRTWGSFRSLTLHLSQDYRQVLAYETWSDRSAFLTAWDSDDVRPFTERIKALSLGVDARVFTIESCVVGSTESEN